MLRPAHNPPQRDPDRWIRAKAWAVGSPEPLAWAPSATDSTTGLQAPGAIGVVPYLSASATNAPITLSFDGLVATAP